MNAPASDSQRSIRSQAAPIFALSVACAAWGLSFTIGLWGMNGMAELCPDAGEAGISALFAIVRFFFATLCVGLLVLPHRRQFTRTEVVGGLLTGATFGAGLFLQMWGLQFTTPSSSAFLTGLVVVMTPLGQAVLLRRAPRPRTWAAIAIAIVGMFVLTNPTGGGFGWGEFLTVLSVIGFTSEILILDYYGRRSDPLRLIFGMFGTCLVFHAALFALLPGSRTVGAPEMAAIAGDWTCRWTMIVTVFVSTMFAFGLMNRFQPKVSPARAALIYCLEPVFAALFSVLLGVERPSVPMLLGGSIILAADAIELTGPVTAKPAASGETEPGEPRPDAAASPSAGPQAVPEKGALP